MREREGSAAFPGSFLTLRGGGLGDSSSTYISEPMLEEGEHWPSDFSSDLVDPETGLKGPVDPVSLEPLRLEDYSSEIDELTRPDPEQYPQAEISRQQYLEERGVLDPAFKASTLHDESWDEEHAHLHPDRLVMHEDMQYRLEEMLQEKPFFRSLPPSFYSVLNGCNTPLELVEAHPDTTAEEQEHLNRLSYNASWRANLEWMQTLQVSVEQ